MKRLDLSFFLTVLMSMAGLQALALSGTVNGISYEFYNSNNEATVTSGSYSGDIVIPSSVKYQYRTYTVTGINNYAFSWCSNLESVSIPKSVNDIGKGIFTGCSKLESIHIEEDNYYYDSRDNCNAIIEKSSNTLIAGCKNTVIPNGIAVIGESAFQGCADLTSVSIPSSVTMIGNKAFYGCAGLSSLIIPSSVTSIGVNVIGNCTNMGTVNVDENNSIYDSRNDCNAIIEKNNNRLIAGCKNTIIPNNVITIGDYAFNECTGLGTIVIPNSVTTIGNSAFYGCTGLNTITIPSSVTTIGNSPFSECNNLANLNIGVSDIGTLFQGNTSISSITFLDGVTNINNNAFQNCTGLTSIEILGNISSIGSNAFSGCTKLASLIITGSVTYIGESTFYNCVNLKTFVIPNGLESIGNDAFKGCGLTSVQIPNSVTTIGDESFYGCTNLETLTIPNSVTSIGSSTFQYCGGLKTLTIGTTYVGAWFQGCSELTTLNLTNDVKSISSHAFENCTGLTNIEIPNSVTLISDEAFKNCSNVASIIIPNSVTSIGDDVFKYCNSVKNVTLGTSNVGDWFRGNTSLTTVTLTDDVVSTSYSAFKDCIGLSCVNIHNGLTTINGDVFSGCSSLSSISIPSSVNYIGGSAFSDCSSLTKVILQDIKAWCSATIFSNPLSYAHHLYSDEETEVKDLVIPDGVSSISANAFDGCSELTSVTLPSSVSKIYSNAFKDCSGISSIFLSNSITIIGSSAFNGCSNLTSVTIDRATPISIDASTFSNRENATLYVPAGSEEAYKSADYWKEFKAIKTIDPNVAVMGMSLTETNVSIDEIGKTHQLTATIVPSNATNKTVNWVSTNTDVCTVSSTGLVTATGEGECYVIATTADGGYTGYCTVNVTLVAPNVAVTGITLNPSVLNFKRIGGTKQIVANVLPADATNKGVNWMSATPTVCSVSETGLVTALGSGNGVVIATTVDGGKMAYCTVNVTPTDHTTITMGSNGIATFSDEDALNFTSVSGVKAYIASGYNPATGDLTMTRVYKVPAGEGLLVKGAAGSYDVPYEETSAYYANLLVGVPTATTVNPTDGDYTNFILSKDEVRGIGFYPLASAGEIGANKAYLQLPTSILPAASRSLRMVFDDEEEETTGINALNDKEKMMNDKAVYDLQGRRVVKPTRGLYIKDGKKIMVK